MATLADVYIDGERIPHLVKHDIEKSESTEKTITYDEVLVDETDETNKFSLSGIRVDRPDVLSEAQLFNMTSNVPNGRQIIVIKGNTKYTYDGAKRNSFKASQDGKKRPTRDMEFEATNLKIEDI